MTDRRTDIQTDWTIHRAAWSQLKTLTILCLTARSSQFFHMIVRNHQFYQFWLQDYEGYRPCTLELSTLRCLTQWCRNKMGAIFQMPFSKAFWVKCINFDKNFTEVCSLGSNSSIGSENGLSLTKRPAIIWTNGGYITDAYIHHSVSMS